MKIFNIQWDTEDNGEFITSEDLDLPTNVDIPEMEEDEVADYLSDEYGWCIKSFEVK